MPVWLWLDSGSLDSPDEPVWPWEEPVEPLAAETAVPMAAAPTAATPAAPAAAEPAIEDPGTSVLLWVVLEMLGVAVSGFLMSAGVRRSDEGSGTGPEELGDPEVPEGPADPAEPESWLARLLGGWGTP